MRKIESEMLAAIRDGRNVSLANTTVTHDPVIGGYEVEVRLHGNLIAKRFLNEAWEVTLAGWNTNTTRSRLRALLTMLGGSLAVKGGTPYLNGTAINTTDWHAL